MLPENYYTASIMSHHSLLTKMNKSLQTSPENQLLINFKHLIGLKKTLGNSHIPRVKLGVSFFVLSFSLVGITYGYKLLHATPKTAMRVQKSKKQNQLVEKSLKRIPSYSAWKSTRTGFAEARTLFRKSSLFFTSNGALKNDVVVM